jgi:hypothetical protein
MVPRSQQPPVGHPFLAVGELKEAPRAPVREHVTPFNPVSHLTMARGTWGGAFRAPCGRTKSIGPTEQRNNRTAAGK